MSTLQELIDKSKRLVFFGGAGVSTASGIPDFRGAGGLCEEEWEGFRPETVLSDRFFYLQTERFFAYYRRFLLHPEARPNAAHRKLYELERAGKLKGLITQNVDGLHRMAGNRLVYELHGTVHENECTGCGAVYPLDWLVHTEGIPHCPECGAVVKPGIVLYGEPLNPYVCRGARREIADCDTLIVAGTSLSVEPAASFLEGFRGRALIVINQTETPADAQASLVLRGSVAEIMDQIHVNGGG